MLICISQSVPENPTFSSGKIERSSELFSEVNSVKVIIKSGNLVGPDVQEHFGGFF